MAALETHDDVGADREPIDDLAFPLVAPLGADDHDIGHERSLLPRHEKPRRQQQAGRGSLRPWVRRLARRSKGAGGPPLCGFAPNTGRLRQFREIGTSPSWNGHGRLHILFRQAFRQARHGRDQMTPEERQMLEGLFGRIQNADSGQRDPQAESFINDAVRAMPHAPYVMAQTVLVQQQAIEAAAHRIAELEATAQEAAERQQQGGGGGFLGGLGRSIFGGGPAPSPAQRDVPPYRGPVPPQPLQPPRGYAPPPPPPPQADPYQAQQRGPWGAPPPSGGRRRLFAERDVHRDRRCGRRRARQPDRRPFRRPWRRRRPVRRGFRDGAADRDDQQLLREFTGSELRAIPASSIRASPTTPASSTIRPSTNSGGGYDDV